MVRTRIAPSPTGFPHIGTIYQAIFNKALVLKNGGQFVLRLEDTDRKRFVEGSENIIYQSLDWVALSPDEGPREGGSFGPYRQSERLEVYRKHALELLERGGAYHCFCSPERLEMLRAEQEKKHQPTIYDRHCLNIDPEEAGHRVKNGESHVIRLKMPFDQKITVEDSIRGPIEFDSNLIDDTVLLKSDGFPTYHLAVAVDDHLMEITHPIRGEEWISSYPKHKVIFDYLSWPMPTYTHLPLLRNPDGSKVSKREGHTSVEWYREQGILPEALVNFLILMVWKHPSGQEIFTLEEFAEVFEFKDISLTGPRFDLKKLEWMNGQYLRLLDKKSLGNRFNEYKTSYPSGFLSRISYKDLFVSLPSITPRINKFKDVESIVKFVDPSFTPDKNIKIRFARKIYENLVSLKKPWTKDEWERSLRSLADDLGVRHGDIFMELRKAVTGSEVGPDLYESIEFIGEDKTIERLRSFLVPPAGVEPALPD